MAWFWLSRKLCSSVGAQLLEVNSAEAGQTRQHQTTELDGERRSIRSIGEVNTYNNGSYLG